MARKIKGVSLSSRWNSPEGDLIARLFLDKVIDCLLLFHEYKSCRYDGGGWHSLDLFLDEEDLNAFFNLVEEFYHNNALIIGCRGLRQKAGV